MENKLEVIDNIVSAWTGHKEFAMWLVKTMQPDTVVELGVDYGYSTFCFAAPNIGTVYGIDWFNGDSQTGYRNTYSNVMDGIQRGNFNNIKIIVDKFDEVAKKWDRPIDILHIDGFHMYEYVKNDFEKWYPFVRDGGIILMHDTISFPDEVGKFFDEINLPKLNFKNSAGLGIVSTDTDLMDKIFNNFKHLL
jgi:predicted O-methyltransferase YrrM